MKWSHEKPKQEGYWWYRERWNKTWIKPWVVNIEDNGWGLRIAHYNCEEEDIPRRSKNRQWAGPLPEPEGE